MASKKVLKKDINNIMTYLIDQCYMIEFLDSTKKKETDKLVDEMVDIYNEVLSKVNDRKIKNPKPHYKKLKEDFQKSTDEIIKKIDKLA